MTTCNLLAYKLDDVITVTRRMSRQINFSLHGKINHIVFEEFFDKTNEKAKDFLLEDC